jgi:hypothetical protein
MNVTVGNVEAWTWHRYVKIKFSNLLIYNFIYILINVCNILIKIKN